MISDEVKLVSARRILVDFCMSKIGARRTMLPIRPGIKQEEDVAFIRISFPNWSRQRFGENYRASIHHSRFFEILAKEN